MLALVLFSYEIISQHSGPKVSPLLQQLRTKLKNKRMIVSKDQIHLTSTVGHGKHLSHNSDCPAAIGETSA